MEIVRSWCCVVFHRMKAPVCICFPGSSAGKESTCQCRRHKRHGFKPWVRKISWRRKWQSTPVSLTGKFHGQRCLAGHTVHGVAESDMTEREHMCMRACMRARARTHTHTHTHTHKMYLLILLLVSSFHFLAIMNSATMDSLEHIFW